MPLTHDAARLHGRGGGAGQVRLGWGSGGWAGGQGCVVRWSQGRGGRYGLIP